MAEQQTLDNGDVLSIQRAKLNNNALDALSQARTTAQSLASDLDFAVGKGVSFDGGDVFGSYEEFGTFSPTVETSGVALDSVAYSFQAGNYCIIGKRLFFDIQMRTSAITIGSGTGNVVFGGFPVPSKAAGVFVAGAISYRDNWTTSPDALLISPGTSKGAAYYYASAGADSTTLAIAALNLGLGNTIRVTGSYFID